MPQFHRIASGLVLLLGWAGALPASAESIMRSSVTSVVLYPGAAAVERSAHVTPSTTEVVFSCLPEGLDAESLRAEGGAGITLGEIRATSVSASNGLVACRHTAVDDRIRAMEDQRASVAAEQEANEITATFLKSIKGSGEEHSSGVTDLRNLPASSDALRRTAEATLAKRQAFERKLEDLDRELEALRDERDKQNTKTQNYQNVTVALRSDRAADLRLIYQVNQAGWTPRYRALLDTATGRVTLEREAQIAQSTGESWEGVRMRLSTVQPRANVTPPEPQTMRVGILAPPAPRDAQGAVGSARMYAAAPAAAAPAPVAASVAPQKSAPPLFEASAFVGVYATEFVVATPVTLPSDGQRLNVTLDRTPLASTLKVRTTPSLAQVAYLIVEAERQPGVWPRGALSLVRDGSGVGSIANWSPQDSEHFSIPFGRDDLVKVTLEPKTQFNSSSGVFGGRSERRIAAAYNVENLHATAIALEILEASPVSTDEQVEVKKTFSPPITLEAWEDRPGVVAWQIPLGPKAKTHVEAQYAITAPKDARTFGY